MQAENEKKENKKIACYNAENHYFRKMEQRILSLSVPCDAFDFLGLKNGEGEEKELTELPPWIPNEFFWGDNSFEISIDIDTGKVIGWKAPEKTQ